MQVLTRKRSRVEAGLAALTMVLLGIMASCGEAGHGFGGGF